MPLFDVRVKVHIRLNTLPVQSSPHPVMAA